LLASADALGLYKTSPEVATRLLSLVEPGRDDAVRASAVRALGYLAEKRIAQKLVDLAGDGRSPVVAGAALDALQTFAPIELDSPAEWSAWWRGEQDKSDAQFRDELLASRASRLDQIRRDTVDVESELSRRLAEQYNRATRDDRPQLLRGFLSSPRESVRLAGVQLAEDLVRTNDLPASAEQQLPSLLDDASPRVRERAARTIQLVNSPAAFDAIARQLSVEREAAVKVELVRALAAQKNPQAIPLLRDLLADASPRVLNATIRAIGAVAPQLVEQSPRDAADLAIRIEAIYKTAPADNAVTREVAIETLAQLRQDSQLDFFRAQLTANPPESVGVRRAAIIGLGNLRNPRVVPLLQPTLRDPSADIRVASIQALAKVSNDATAAESLLERCDDSREKDERVRTEAWAAVQTLFRYMSDETLSLWLGRPGVAGVPQRKLDVCKALLAKAQVDPSRIDEQMSRLQQIGDVQLELDKPADAVESFEAALQLARTHKAPDVRVISLAQSELRARLLTGDYAGATVFAAGMFKESSSNYRDLMSVFKTEVTRLQDANQLDSARKLVEQLLAMQPGLPSDYLAQFQGLQRDLRDRQNQRNQSDLPAWTDRNVRVMNS
jgi:HEAT repeat protein